MQGLHSFRNTHIKWQTTPRCTHNIRRLRLSSNKIVVTNFQDRGKQYPSSFEGHGQKNRTRHPGPENIPGQRAKLGNGSALTKMKLSQDVLDNWHKTAERYHTNVEKEMDKEIKAISDTMTKKTKTLTDLVNSAPKVAPGSFKEYLEFMKGKTGGSHFTAVKKDIEAAMDKLTSTATELGLEKKALYDKYDTLQDIEKRGDEICEKSLEYVTMFALCTCITNDDVRKPVPGKQFRDSIEYILETMGTHLPEFQCIVDEAKDIMQTSPKSTQKKESQQSHDDDATLSSLAAPPKKKRRKSSSA